MEVGSGLREDRNFNTRAFNKMKNSYRSKVRKHIFTIDMKTIKTRRFHY